MTKVVIGVDPHKRLNAVVVINVKGKVLARRQFPNSAEGFRAFVLADREGLFLSGRESLAAA